MVQPSPPELVPPRRPALPWGRALVASAAAGVVGNLMVLFGARAAGVALEVHLPWLPPPPPWAPPLLHPAVVALATLVPAVVATGVMFLLRRLTRWHADVLFLRAAGAVLLASLVPVALLPGLALGARCVLAVMHAVTAVACVGPLLLTRPPPARVRPVVSLPQRTRSAELRAAASEARHAQGR